MKRFKNFSTDEFIDKLMDRSYSGLMFIKNKCVDFVSSPPKKVKSKFSTGKKKFSRLFRFSITFKITLLSLFKLLRQLIFLEILLSIGFFILATFFVRSDMIDDMNLFSKSYNSSSYTRNRKYLNDYTNSKDILVLATLGQDYSIDTSESYLDLHYNLNDSQEESSEEISNGTSIEDSSSSTNNSNLDGYSIDIPALEDPIEDYSQSSNDSLASTLLNNDFFFIKRFNAGLSKSTKGNLFFKVSKEYTIDSKDIQITFFKSIDYYLQLYYKCLIGLSIFFLLFLRSNGKYVSALTKRMLHPVHVMNDAIKEINVSNLDMRLNIHGSKDELKDLSITVNNMFDRIQESYNKQKQFVSDASHELRTPIAVVQGYANLLNRWGKDDPEVLQESIDAIKDESENMKDLVEKLLFLARADKNTQKMNKEIFDLSVLVNNICKEFKLIDSSHNITCSSEDNLLVYGDEKLIKQAIRILMDNAIKYTPPEGYISIKAFPSVDTVYIQICDTGIGIPPKSIPHIFDRFYRVDESRSKGTDKGGTGLGLSIAHWIAEVHNGTIKVESIPEKGSIFTITLPYSESMKTAERENNSKESI